jgi:hypothetical protein
VNWKGYERKWWWPNLRYYTSILPGRTEENHEKLQ